MKINSHNHTNDSSDKKQRCQNYIHALEEERHKIQVFQRELPLCFELVTQAIEACKQQLSGTTTEYNLNGQSECSEQTSAPVLEEFMPIKRPSSSSDEHESKAAKNDTNITVNKDGKICNNDKNSKKSDWLRSVQLWNQTPDPPSNEDLGTEVGVVEVKRNGAFQPFKKEKNNIGDSETAVVPPVPPASTSSTAETGGAGNKNKEKEGQSQRKSRRCWSPELHKRFLQALQQLGGSHIATPKQIRELMKVDGLTNDEVKSHLQKYRLHTRRPSSSIQNNNNNNNNTQTPQFVVVGGIWMPPEYAAMATTANSGEGHTSTGIYAPIASHPTPQRQPPPSDDRGGRSEGGARSHSPATSSSTHTSTASQAY